MPYRTFLIQINPPPARHRHSGFAGLPDLSIWLSVDPMSDKYPRLSPYVYCANNPVKLVDPNGEEIGDYFDLNGFFLGSDGIDDGKVYVVDSKNWDQIKNTGFVSDNGK